jgi:myo-inositol catabolism protein IolC
MFELLVPMMHEQSDRLEGDQHLYDHDLRPSLMIAAIKELQNAGVEPDVWKIEGLDQRDDCAAVVTAAQRGGRNKVGCIILGRGSNEAGIIAWLRAAAPVPGFIGFAVGRTSFLGRAGRAARQQDDAREGGRDYRQLLRRVVRTFEDARRG